MARRERKRGAAKKPPTPPKPNPWDVPTPPHKGDEKKETLFAAVGSALSAWESIEIRLSNIFSTLVSPRSESLPAQRAYGSVLTFRGRSEMISAAADAAFFLTPDDTLHHDLSKLLDQIGRFAARRNEIAHGRVTTYYTAPRSGFIIQTVREMPAGYILEPPNYATNKTKLAPGRIILETAHHKPSYAYSSVEIGVLEKHFVRLEEEAQNFSIRLWRLTSRRRP